MEVLENLQELKELNQRQARVDFEGMIEQYRELERAEKEREKEEDERETKWVGRHWLSLCSRIAFIVKLITWMCPLHPQRDAGTCLREKTQRHRRRRRRIFFASKEIQCRQQTDRHPHHRQACRGSGRSRSAGLRWLHVSGEITDVLWVEQGTSGTGVKKAKSESWERSVGTLSGRGALGSLVVRKKPPSASSEPPVATPAASTSPAGEIAAAAHRQTRRACLRTSLCQCVHVVCLI